MYVSKRVDGSFETLVGGFPYHVTSDDPMYVSLAVQYPDLNPTYADVDGVIMEDNRGVSGWLDGVVFVMKEFGPLPQGFTQTPPMAEQARAFESGVEAWLDAFAKTRSYKDIVSAASYIASKNEYFKAEAEYAADLRDRTWEWANMYMNDVLTGQKPIPTWEHFIAELIEAVQPEWPVEDTRAKAFFE